MTPLTHCLACRAADLVPYLDLGEQPLANAFHTPGADQPRYPLGLQRCPACWHSQNLVAVGPDLMFRDYLYVSGTSRTLRDYFERFVDRVEAQQGKGLRVLEIGCNDGTLLAEFARRGHLAMGVDPAGVPIVDAPWMIRINGYWCAEMAAGWRGNFDVVVAMNVLGHVADPATFLSLAKDVLAPHGRIYIQTSQAGMIANAEFDTVYHEHLSFFSERSFQALASRVGLSIARMSRVSVHGGSHLVEMVAEPCDTIVSRAANDPPETYDETDYDTFQWRVRSIRDAAHAAMSVYGPRVDHVIGYGAAAKGMVFLNYTGIRPEMIVDDNPLKVGLLTPGQDIPVVGADRLAGIEGRCLFLILAWNFREEIIERIKAVRLGRTDLYLTFMPRVTVS